MKSSSPSCDLGREYPVAENPFPSLAVDLTHRCNMACRYCYNPERDRPEMTLDYFAACCRLLPRPVNFKFLGGEPTLHADFFRFIATAHEHGHGVFFSSNGVNYTHDDFMVRLAGSTAPFVPGLSLDGGLTHEEYYEQIAGQPCLAMKRAAFANLMQYRIGRVALTAILVRGLNEPVIRELIDLADRHADLVRYIHFRSVGRVGRWQETQPLTMAELKALVQPHFSAEAFAPRCFREPHCPPEAGRECCYRFRPNRRLQISLIEFATPRAAQCEQRGKLLDERFVVQPFFENMLLGDGPTPG